MKMYSSYHHHHSLVRKNNIIVDIPGGTSTPQKDWYPFVMTFNDNNFKSKVGEEIHLSVMYNFGAFKNGRSTLYDENSPYYNSFYGAYIIECSEGEKIYGFNGKEVNIDEISAVASHDLEVLVLESMGCIKPQVSFQNRAKSKTLDYISYSNWTVIDSDVYMNSAIHQYHRDYISYIQYGKPPKDYKGDNFPEVSLAGRIYCRYFPEYKVSILLYIIAPDFEVIEETDRTILSKTKISKDLP